MYTDRTASINDIGWISCVQWRHTTKSALYWLFNRSKLVNNYLDLSKRKPLYYSNTITRKPLSYTIATKNLRLLGEPCDPASLTAHFRRTGSHHGCFHLHHCTNHHPLHHHHHFTLHDDSHDNHDHHVGQNVSSSKSYSSLSSSPAASSPSSSAPSPSSSPSLMMS